MMQRSLLARTGAILLLATPATGQSWRDGTLPATRFGSVAVPSEGRVLLFGGQAGLAPVTSSWWYDGLGFAPAAPMTDPGPRATGMVAHDPLRGRTYCVSPDDPAPRTWQHDGTSWSVHPTSRTPNVQSGRMVFVGHVGASLLVATDGSHWTFDGSDWARWTGTRPSARSDFGLAYDPSRQRVVLHGGIFDNLLQDDTWEFDGTQWQQSSPSTAPPAGGTHLAYDASLGVIIARMYSFVSATDWRYDGTAWSELAVSQTWFAWPERQSAHASGDRPRAEHPADSTAVRALPLLRRTAGRHMATPAAARAAIVGAHRQRRAPRPAAGLHKGIAVDPKRHVVVAAARFASALVARRRKRGLR